MASDGSYIVGIDLGYTHTGVAYARNKPGEVPIPRVIQHWPGKQSENYINKVPTKLSYRGEPKKYLGWGFDLREPSIPHSKVTTYATKCEIVEYFKLHLDNNILQQAYHGQPDEFLQEEHDIAKRHFEDYLRALYGWIKQTLEEEEGVIWENTTIKFIFSVPTTWGPDVITTYSSIFKKADYQKCGLHKISVGLTEAEAAAVYTALYNEKGQARGTQLQDGSLKEGDILIICDAGGGTTDISVSEIGFTEEGKPTMQHRGCVQGAAIGSVNIDSAFTDLAKNKLDEVKKKPGHGDLNSWRAADMMTSGEFQQIKSNFGDKNSMLLESIDIPIPNLDSDSKTHGSSIRRGSIVFKVSEIKKLFNDQIEGFNEVVDGQNVRVRGINDLIDAQLESLEENTNQKYLVLSGGLGSSKYLRKCLEDRYNKQGVTIMVANDPQLVVCRGLILHHLNASIISGWYTRDFYGIAYEERYNRGKNRHDKSRRIKNPIDKKYYVPDKIEWLVKKKELITSDSLLEKEFHQSLSLNNPRQPLKHRIVRYDGDLSSLPDEVTAPGVKTVGEIECILGSAIENAPKGKDLEVQIKRRHRGNPWSTKFCHVKYRINLRMGPVGMQPELWFCGEKRNQNEDIRVRLFEGYQVACEGNAKGA